MRSKSLYYLLIFILVPFLLLGCGTQKHAHNQPKVILPVINGRIFFEKVIEFPNVSKQDLFLRGRMWAVNIFKDANEVLQISDKEVGQLTGKGLFYLFEGQYPQVYFTFNLQYKDNKYRVQFYDFRFQSRNPFTGEKFKRYGIDVYRNYIHRTTEKRLSRQQRFSQERDRRYLAALQIHVKRLMRNLYMYETGKLNTDF